MGRFGHSTELPNRRLAALAGAVFGVFKLSVPGGVGYCKLASALRRQPPGSRTVGMNLPQRLLPAALSTLLRGSRRLAGAATSPADIHLAIRDARNRLNRWSFLVLVVVPVVLACLFYGLMAAPRHVSEARFIVRSVSSVRLSGLDMFLRTFGFAKAVDDAYLIQRYLLSRDVVGALAVEGVDLRAIYTRKEADVLSRYPRLWRKDSNEALYDYFVDHITVAEDSVKGVLTLRVESFRPQDSFDLATTMLRLAEAMVNRMNERAQRDAMSSALKEVRIAEDGVIAAQTNIAAFRTKEVLLDPSKSSLSLIETIGTLTTDLAYASAQLNEMQASSPSNPTIPGLKARIVSLTERIALERAKMAGGSNSLTDKIGNYEQLALRRDLADKSLTSALGALEVARQEARRQHIYIESVSAANLSDEATEPRRLRGMITVMFVGFALFSLVWILSVGAGEHSQ